VINGEEYAWWFWCCVSALNPCDYNNGGCEQQCIRETPTVSGQLAYRCSCQHGVLAPDNHTCVSSGQSLICYIIYTVRLLKPHHYAKFTVRSFQILLYIFGGSWLVRRVTGQKQRYWWLPITKIKIRVRNWVRGYFLYYRVDFSPLQYPSEFGLLTCDLLFSLRIEFNTLVRCIQDYSPLDLFLYCVRKRVNP